MLIPSGCKDNQEFKKIISGNSLKLTIDFVKY